MIVSTETHGIRRARLIRRRRCRLTTRAPPAGADRPLARGAADDRLLHRWRRWATPSPSASARCRSARCCSPATPCRRSCSCRWCGPAAAPRPRRARLAPDACCVPSCTSARSARSSRRCASCRWPTPSRIAFVMPFILLLLGRFTLGEEVGPRRLAACAVGFLGTLLVVQPSFAAVGAPGAAAAGRRAPLRALHAGDPPDRPRRRSGGAAGRERPRRHPRPRPARSCSPKAAAGPSSTRWRPPAADWAPTPPPRRPRHRRAPLHDLVAALRALGHPRADAVPRDPLRHPHRLPASSAPCPTASPRSASPSPSPPASTSSTASAPPRLRRRRPEP